MSVSISLKLNAVNTSAFPEFFVDFTLKLRGASHIAIYFEKRHCDVSLKPPPCTPHGKRHAYFSIFS